MSGDPSEPNYSGGVTLDHLDPRWVFLAKQVNGKFEILAYRTTDGGHTWGSRVVTTHSGRGNYRPIRPRGQPGTDMDIVWMRGGYPSFTDYQTAIDVETLSRDVVSPSAVALDTGQLQVLASDGTGALISKSLGPSGWSGWTGVGRGPAGHVLGAPALASSAPGRLDLFVVDKVTGHLLQRASVDGVWGAWSDRGAGPGGHPISAPTVASWGPGRLDVLARDNVTLRLLHWWFNGSWHGPESLMASPGGVIVPSVAAWGSNRLDVFAVTDRGTLAHAWWDGRWHRWQSLGAGPGGVAYKTPAAVAAWGSRRLDVFAATSGGQTLAHRWFTGSTGWLGPETLAAGTGPDRLPLIGMTATSWAPGRLDVFSTDARNHGLLHTWYSTGWHGPEHVDFTNAAPTILADPSPQAAPIPVDPRALDLADD